jgi:GNAT superfamily N-acetyltransferase
MSDTIRRLTIDDFDDIMRVWSDSGLPIRPNGRERRETFAKEIALPQVAVFGLFEEERMLAVGIANWDGVAVDPDHRGRGLAGKIIKECEAFLNDCGALAIAALIEDINYPSITAFQKEGFQCLREILYLSKYAFPGA